MYEHVGPADPKKRDDWHKHGGEVIPLATSAAPTAALFRKDSSQKGLFILASSKEGRWFTKETPNQLLQVLGWSQILVIHEVPLNGEAVEIWRVELEHGHQPAK